MWKGITEAWHQVRRFTICQYQIEPMEMPLKIIHAYFEYYVGGNYLTRESVRLIVSFDWPELT
jgi:hypothetical protein